MKLTHRIGHRLKAYYRLAVVREQYPMLTRLSRRELKKQGALGAVYMLHHIAPKDPMRIPTNEDLKVSPQFLEEIIQNYRKQGVDMISLDEVYERLTSENHAVRPFVAFTIDDGYLDNYVNALPVFEKYQVPFAVFVATDFIDKKAILWWDSIEELIMTHDDIVTSDGKRFSCGTFRQRWDTFRWLRNRVLTLDQSHLQAELDKLFEHYNVDWYEPIRRQGMSWQQVKELAHHPLCTIGGHTVTHPALNKLDADDVQREIVAGIHKIEQETGCRVHDFAYPYGTPNEIGDREQQMVETLGLRMAFMAHQGCVTSDNRTHLTKLPRFYLMQR